MRVNLKKNSKKTTNYTDIAQLIIWCLILVILIFLLIHQIYPEIFTPKPIVAAVETMPVVAEETSKASWWTKFISSLTWIPSALMNFYDWFKSNSNSNSSSGNGQGGMWLPPFLWKVIQVVTAVFASFMLRRRIHQAIDGITNWFVLLKQRWTERSTPLGIRFHDGETPILEKVQLFFRILLIEPFAATFDLVIPGRGVHVDNQPVDLANQAEAEADLGGDPLADLPQLPDVPALPALANAADSEDELLGAQAQPLAVPPLLENGGHNPPQNNDVPQEEIQPDSDSDSEDGVAANLQHELNLLVEQANMAAYYFDLGGRRHQLVEQQIAVPQSQAGQPQDLLEKMTFDRKILRPSYTATPNVVMPPPRVTLNLTITDQDTVSVAFEFQDLLSQQMDESSAIAVPRQELQNLLDIKIRNLEREIECANLILQEHPANRIMAVFLEKRRDELARIQNPSVSGAILSGNVDRIYTDGYEPFDFLDSTKPLSQRDKVNAAMLYVTKGHQLVGVGPASSLLERKVVVWKRAFDLQKIFEDRFYKNDDPVRDKTLREDFSMESGVHFDGTFESKTQANSFTGAKGLQVFDLNSEERESEKLPKRKWTGFGKEKVEEDKKGLWNSFKKFFKKKQKQ